MRRKTVITCVIILAVITAGLVIYFFTSIGTGTSQLNEAQTESLCDAFVDTEIDGGTDYRGLEATSQAAVKIFGVDRKGNTAMVYGYVSVGDYVRFKDKAYDVSGGNWVFMVKIKYEGNQVRILKSYGDGVSTSSTLDEMPLRYRIKAKNYEAYDESGYCKIMRKADKKAEAALGVPVETQYTLSIDEESGYYEVYDIDSDGETVMKYKGKIEELGKDGNEK